METRREEEKSKGCQRKETSPERSRPTRLLNSRFSTHSITWTCRTNQDTTVPDIFDPLRFHPGSMGEVSE